MGLEGLVLSDTAVELFFCCCGGAECPLPRNLMRGVERDADDALLILN